MSYRFEAIWASRINFDLDIWPLEVIWGQVYFAIQKPIHDFLSKWYGHFLSISYSFSDICLQNFKGSTLTFDS